jgi:hypothetical protein
VTGPPVDGADQVTVAEFAPANTTVGVAGAPGTTGVIGSDATL